MLKKVMSVILGVLMVSSAAVIGTGSASAVTENLPTAVQSSNLPDLPTKTPDNEIVNGGKVIEVKAGQKVNYSISMKTPMNTCGMSFYFYYNSDVITPDTTYGDYNGFNLVNGLDMPEVNSKRNGMFAYIDANVSGNSKFNNGAEIANMQFTAVKDGFAMVYYNIFDVCCTNSSTDPLVSYWSAGEELISGVEFTNTISASSEGVGDINGDGKVNLVDASMLARYLNKTIVLTQTQKEAADINNDGIIDLYDVVRIHQYVAHIVPIL